MNLLLTGWFLLIALSLVYIIWDSFKNTPTGAVMKLAWVLVGAYTGPIGALIYSLSCRKPKDRSHDEFIAPTWKQATGSLLHCVAGDATGIILAAIIVSFFGLPNGFDLIIEYGAAFIVGLLIFQALFMISMYGDYWLAVRKTLFAETVSMNMVMLGMFPVMLILKEHVPHSDSPARLEFWGVMSVATIAAMITAYPINYWMVKRGLKHGMMSAKPKSTKPELIPVAADGAGSHGRGGAMDMAMPQPDDGGEHRGHTMKHDAMAHKTGDHTGHAMGAKPKASSAHADMEMPEHGGMDGPVDSGHGEHSRHEAASLPVGQAVGIVLGTFALLFLAIWLTSFLVPIRFSN
ncbi:MAG: DUF4396 domain-containing protein [Verrucomicrobiota bacterium]